MERLLLHACCAPDAAHGIQQAKPNYEIVCFFYNPNIDNEAEYEKREQEARKVAEHFAVEYVSGGYDVEKWREAIRGYEDCPEGGDRCRICYQLRLTAAAAQAAKSGCSAFTTVLTVSPHKNAKALFAIGQEAAAQTGVRFLDIDFKKKDGFKKSVALSNELGLYRQNYCGCSYSKREASQRRS